MDPQLITQLGPVGGLSLALLMIGFFLKKSPLQNWWIPWIVAALGGAVYPLIAIAPKDGTINPFLMTITIERWLSGVKIDINNDGSSAFRGYITKRTRDGNDVVREVEVRTLNLTGTNLETALANANLPTSTNIVIRLRNLFHAAYTNELTSSGQTP